MRESTSCAVNKPLASPPTKHFSPRVPKPDLVAAVADYDVSQDTEALAVGKVAQQVGHVTREQLVALVRWKSPRSISRAQANRPEFVREVTSASFGAGDEQLRVEVLTLLRGVGWPTASVILHFCVPDQYPILDIRALWTLGLDQVPTYNFAFWENYTAYCQELAVDMHLSMRDLDRALWQYSKNVGKTAAS